MPDPPQKRGNLPPPENRDATLPYWLDPKNAHGELMYLILEAVGGGSLPKNPFIVGKTLKNCAGELSEPGKIIDNGSKYLLKTRNKTQFVKLQTITQLIDGTRVSIVPHATLNSVQCVIFAPDLKELSEEEILTNLSDQKITQVKRFNRKINNELVPTNSILLTITTTRVPEFIRMGPLHITTRPYYPKPMVCYNCARFGHTKLRCKSVQICPNCSTAAHGDCSNQAKCLNCKGNHNSFSKDCPTYKAEEQIIKYKVDHNISFADARKYFSQATESSSVQQRISNAQIANPVPNEKDQKIAMLEKALADSNKLVDTLTTQIKKLSDKFDRQEEYIKTHILNTYTNTKQTTTENKKEKTTKQIQQTAHVSRNVSSFEDDTESENVTDTEVAAATRSSSSTRKRHLSQHSPSSDDDSQRSLNSASPNPASAYLKDKTAPSNKPTTASRKKQNRKH